MSQSRTWQSRRPRGLQLAPSWGSVPERSAECQPHPSLLQGRPRPTKGFPGMCPQRVPCGLPGSSIQCGQALGSRHRLGPGGLLPGQRDPRRLRSETDLDSRLRCVVLGESLRCPSTQVLACKMRTFLCRREGDDAQHVAGTLKTRRVPAVLSSPGEGSGWARPSPVQQPKSHSRGRKPGPRTAWTMAQQGVCWLSRLRAE